MRTKQKAALLVEQRLARDRVGAYHEARALAIELARGEPSTAFDPMAAGLDAITMMEAGARMGSDPDEAAFTQL